MSLFKFPTDLKHVKEASKKVLDHLNDLKLDEAVLFDIKLCFEEAFINAVKYGNELNSRLTVNVEILKRAQEIEIIVCDCGKECDLQKLEDPTEEKNLTKTHGRGFFIIKKLMDKVWFDYDCGNRIHMIKKIKGA